MPPKSDPYPELTISYRLTTNKMRCRCFRDRRRFERLVDPLVAFRAVGARASSPDSCGRSCSSTGSQPCCGLGVDRQRVKDAEGRPLFAPQHAYTPGRMWAFVISKRSYFQLRGSGGRRKLHQNKSPISLGRRHLTRNIQITIRNTYLRIGAKRRTKFSHIDFLIYDL